MSWIDSLKKIKNSLAGKSKSHTKKQKRTLETYTLQELEVFFSSNTSDKTHLDELITELTVREEECDRSGREITPSHYNLRFVAAGRLQELNKQDGEEEERDLSVTETTPERQDEVENDDEDPKQSRPEIIIEEVVNAGLVPIAKTDINRQKKVPHPSEQFTDTQFMKENYGERQLEIRIGLDFGTAFTKVVLGIPLGALAVPLNGNLQKSSDYLLPGILSIAKNGNYHLGAMEGRKQIDDLKMKIIESRGELELELLVHVVAYLALLFRRIRWWWIDQQGAPEVFRNHSMVWVINSGLPTESMSGIIPSLYRRAILAAWAASVDGGNINIKQIKETCELAALDQSIVTYDENGQQRYLKEDALELLPEFLAQTAGYITHDSMDKRRLHAMVDIGAGTIDMTIFNVYEWKGAIRHAIYGKKVVPFGVNYLIKERINELEKDESLVHQFYTRDISDQQFADMVGIQRNRLDESDKPFLNQVINSFLSLRNRVKNDPDISQDADLLEKGIKLFLAGGGARIATYRDRFRALARANQREGNPVNRIEIGQLPDLGQDEDRERRFVAPGLDRNDYDRLSVAYGLSGDPWNLADLLDEEQFVMINASRRGQNRSTKGDTGGAFWDDPNAPPVW